MSTGRLLREHIWSLTDLGSRMTLMSRGCMANSVPIQVHMSLTFIHRVVLTTLLSHWVNVKIKNAACTIPQGLVKVFVQLLGAIVLGLLLMKRAHTLES